MPSDRRLIVWHLLSKTNTGLTSWHLQYFSVMALELCNLYQMHYLSMGIWQLGSGTPPTASGNLCPHWEISSASNSYPLCHILITTENQWLGMSPMALVCIWTLNGDRLLGILSAILNKRSTIYKLYDDWFPSQRASNTELWCFLSC